MLHNKLCQALNNSTLTNTWFTNENRIILLSSAKNLTDTHNLFLSTYNRIEFSLGSCLSKIGTETIEYRCL